MCRGVTLRPGWSRALQLSSEELAFRCPVLPSARLLLTERAVTQSSNDLKEGTRQNDAGHSSLAAGLCSHVAPAFQMV